MMTKQPYSIEFSIFIISPLDLIHHEIEKSFLSVDQVVFTVDEN